MYGAIIGDLVGSVYEFDNIKMKDFPLFSPRSTFTDDSIMTIAVAKAIVKTKLESYNRSIDARSIDVFQEHMILFMREYGKKIPASYGRIRGKVFKLASWYDQRTL